VTVTVLKVVFLHDGLTSILVVLLAFGIDAAKYPSKRVGPVDPDTDLHFVVSLSLNNEVSKLILSFIDQLYKSKSNIYIHSNEIYRVNSIY